MKIQDNYHRTVLKNIHLVTIWYRVRFTTASSNSTASAHIVGSQPASSFSKCFYHVLSNPRSESESEEEEEEELPLLSEEEMNKLGAKLVKAELMGNMVSSPRHLPVNTGPWAFKVAQSVLIGCRCCGRLSESRVSFHTGLLLKLHQGTGLRLLKVGTACRARQIPKDARWMWTYKTPASLGSHCHAVGSHLAQVSNQSAMYLQPWLLWRREVTVKPH